ncbi:aspartic proteinase nepenthesin-2-like [Papaver somniferum]|uniref:aspartic proteinase nepenthesin-2-like n=1 Tax=Papaver somniferum TaxID=3469 RepID=UPI000E6FD4C8|nr:aspartic proteinase nepenthesin-2-like [Papaver somniferum]
MIHIDSKESPLHQGDHLTPDDRLQRLFEQSKAKARYMESQILLESNATRSVNPDVVRFPVVYDLRSFYVAMVGLGSDQTWLQCEGASKTFKQDMPLYPARSSTTFRIVPCKTHPLCTGDRCALDGDCTYKLAYGGGSVTYGVIAEEKFTLGSDADGTIGHGGQEIRTTPFLVPKLFKTSLYYLNLEDISIGKTRIVFPRGTFELTSRGTGSCIIDSGTPLSMMYRGHFDEVENLVKAHFDELGVEYIGKIHSYEVCFRLPGKFDTANFPWITLHFQRADYVISDYRANFVMRDFETACLAIFPKDTDTGPFILGAYQQVNKRILHNIIDQSLSFADEYCELGS